MQLPDDLCGCRSGKRYGDCHKPVFDAPKGDVLKVAYRIYAEEWSGNASEYLDQGLYRILASELADQGDIRRVLDVGCGLGHSLSALVDQFPNDEIALIGIDENPDCLAVALDRLGTPQLSSNIARMRCELLSNGKFISTYQAGGIVPHHPITLIQSDIIVNDQSLADFLNTVGPLDAITLWFSGTHKARSEMELSRYFEIKSDSDMRELVEDATIQFAKRYLRIGGSLQIVGRGAFESVAFARAEYARAFGDLVDGRSLEIQSITPYPYSEPSSDSAIKVRSLYGEFEDLQTFAVSVLIRKIA